ncbi:E3 ubiquitin-protein ligase TRIM39-like [Lissotriton helveticus]
MAAAAQLGNLKEEATCSICLEYFTDPVIIIDCGHNFCRSCITQSWEGRDGNFPCPECRAASAEKNIRPNRQLRNMVEIAKQIHLPPVKTSEENLCEKHEEKLRLFCAEDQRMICLVCRESNEHKTHSESPVEVVAKEHKVKLQEWLRLLKKEEEYILESKVKEEEQYKTMRKPLSKKMTMKENANITKLSNQITSLKALITEIEKKCEAPAWELLKDVGSTLSRCNNVMIQSPEAVKSYKVMVTLDPDTAHPKLRLSEGRRHVRDKGKAQRLSDTPKRFTEYTVVLGSEGFTSGRHYWEVQLLPARVAWTVGVVAESVDRKEYFKSSPEEGVWAVEVFDGHYKAMTSPITRLFPRGKPLKLGMFLEYEGGRLSLYNADSMKLLYTFPQVSFTERLFPYFGLWFGAELRVM